MKSKRIPFSQNLACSSWKKNRTFLHRISEFVDFQAVILFCLMSEEVSRLPTWLLIPPPNPFLLPKRRQSQAVRPCYKSSDAATSFPLLLPAKQGRQGGKISRTCSQADKGRKGGRLEYYLGNEGSSPPFLLPPHTLYFGMAPFLLFPINT